MEEKGLLNVPINKYSFVCIHALDEEQLTLSRQQGLVNEHANLIICAPNIQ